jgi:hypothetical protein
MSNVGQAALIVVGTVVGAYFGNPQLGFVLGSLAGAALFPTQLPRGPQLTDNRTTTAEIGTPVAIVFGTANVAGTVIFLAPFVQTTNSAKGGPQQTTYSYNQSIALGLCESVIDGEQAIGGITRIWENGTIVYDIRPQLQADTAIGQLAETDQEYANRLAASAAYAETFVLYLGTEDQMPDPTIEAQWGVGATPAFRGLAYIVYPNRLLQTAQAWRHPNFKFEVYQVGTGQCTDTGIYSNEVLYPWGDDRNVYTYQVALLPEGSGSPPYDIIYNDLPTAQAAAQAYTGFAQSIYMGYDVNANFDNVVGTVVPLSGSAAISPPTIDPSQIVLCYNFILPTDGLRETQTEPSDDPASLFATPGSQWWQPTGGDGGAGSTGIFLTTDVPDADFDAYPPWDPPYQGGSRWEDFYWYEYVTDTQFYQNRKPGAPNPPCYGLTPSIQYPGFALNAQGFLVKCNPWVLDTTTTYKVLQSFEAQTGPGGTSNYATRYPLNPCLPVGAPEYDDETFWTTAYLQAVEDGTMASGLAYGTDYPVTQDFGYAVDSVICQGAGASVSLASIITALCARAGLMAVDVSDMTSVSVDGYAISNVTDAATAITPLRSIGFFDAVESGTVLRFQARGKPTIATLTADDIGAYDSSSNDASAVVPPSMTTQRADETTLPRTIRFHYIATSRDYQDGEQDSPFEFTTRAVDDVDVQIAVAMGDVQAAQCAQVLWADAWAGQTTQEFSVDQSWYELECGDCIFVPVDGVDTRVRIVAETNSSGVLRKFSCVRDDQAAVVSFATVDPPVYQPQKLTFISPTDAEYMDLPALQDSDSDPGFYVAVFADPSTGNSWKGCTVYKSVDGGATFNPAFSEFNQSTVGSIASAVPASEFFTWDMETEVIVNVSSSSITFESLADDAVLAGGNAAAMGANERWEIIQFATATQLSPTQWKLTRLLRGRRGTEWVLGSSQAGDAFVMLIAADLSREVLNTTEIGAQRIYQPISIGLASGTETAFIGYAMALRPFSPVDVTAARQMNGDILISWTRRDRLGRTLMSGVDMPLSEATLAFQVDILNHTASPFTVLRTLATLSTSVTYTHAEQEADYGSPLPDSLSVRVYQMSAVVGRGTAGVGDDLAV